MTKKITSSDRLKKRLAFLKKLEIKNDKAKDLHSKFQSLMGMSDYDLRLKSNNQFFAQNASYFLSYLPQDVLNRKIPKGYTQEMLVDKIKTIEYGFNEVPTIFEVCNSNRFKWIQKRYKLDADNLEFVANLHIEYGAKPSFVAQFLKKDFSEDQISDAYQVRENLKSQGVKKTPDIDLLLELDNRFEILHDPGFLKEIIDSYGTLDAAFDFAETYKLPDLNILVNREFQREYNVGYYSRG